MVYDAQTPRRYGASIVGEGLVESKQVKLAADLSTASATFVDIALMTLAFTSTRAVEKLNCFLAAAIFNSGGYGVVALNIDGSDVASTYQHTGMSGAISLVWQHVIAPGAHVVKLRWRAQGGTTQCNAVSGPTAHSMRLLVERVTV